MHMVNRKTKTNSVLEVSFPVFSESKGIMHMKLQKSCGQLTRGKYVYDLHKSAEVIRVTANPCPSWEE